MTDLHVKVMVDTAAVEAHLGALAGPALAQALAAGLTEAAEAIASDVAMRGIEAGLTPRSPHGLFPSIGAWPASELLAYVGVPAESPAIRHAWLLTEEDKHIVPHGHPFLAIPIGDNVTGGGIGGGLFASPRDIPRDQIAWRGRTVGTVTAKRGIYHPLFALVEEVWIFGRGALEAAAEAAPGPAAETVQRHVDALLS